MTHPPDLPILWITLPSGRQTLAEGFDRTNTEHLAWLSWWLERWAPGYDAVRFDEIVSMLDGLNERLSGRGILMKTLQWMTKPALWQRNVEREEWRKRNPSGNRSAAK